MSAKKLAGDFKLSKATTILVRDEEDKKAALFFNDYLDEVYGFMLPVGKDERKDFIRLTTKKNEKTPAKDGYTLLVLKGGITIDGDTHAGTFYGVQSLIQLLEPYDFKSIISKKNGISVSSLLVPSVSVQDYPRFSYRGMHLDVGRHLYPVRFIKKYIDYIALHKMNFFHWHLTDDQGWRIEIKKYPKLTEVGGYRNGTIVGHY
ncbi:MAG TPA: family 20 glycosylhydrolase, partial [Flavisolibacter sp.]|nr:family 20 glycosylhydrolase [Flavisolibacter sp.]